MTFYALVTGTLWESPVQRLSKNANAFVAATVKVKDGNDSQWVKLLAFGTDAQAELMRLDSGDALSAQGSFKADIYAPEGREPRVNLTVFAKRSPAVARTAEAEEPAEAEIKRATRTIGRLGRMG